jgi:hypothetical protein
MFYSDLNFDSTVRNSKTTDSIFMNDRYNLSGARLVFLLIFDYSQLLLSVSIPKILTGWQQQLQQLEALHKHLDRQRHHLDRHKRHLDRQ